MLREQTSRVFWTESTLQAGCKTLVLHQEACKNGSALLCMSSLWHSRVGYLK